MPTSSTTQRGGSEIFKLLVEFIVGAEIIFDRPVMDVIEMVGEHVLVWLN